MVAYGHWTEPRASSLRPNNRNSRSVVVSRSNVKRRACMHVQAALDAPLITAKIRNAKNAHELGLVVLRNKSAFNHIHVSAAFVQLSRMVTGRGGEPKRARHHLPSLFDGSATSMCSVDNDLSWVEASGPYSPLPSSPRPTTSIPRPLPPRPTFTGSGTFPSTASPSIVNGDSGPRPVSSFSDLRPSPSPSTRTSSSSSSPSPSPSRRNDSGNLGFQDPALSLPGSPSTSPPPPFTSSMAPSGEYIPSHSTYDARAPMLSAEQRHVLQLLLSMTPKHIDLMDVQGISNSVYSLAMLRYYNPPLLESLLGAVEYRLDMCTPQNLSNLILGVSYLRHTPGRHWMKSYYSAVEINIELFGPQDVANTLWAFGRLLHRGEQYKLPSGVVSALLQQSYHHMGQYDPQELVICMWGLARLGFAPGLAWSSQFFSSTYLRLSSFSVSNLSLLAWSMGQLGLTPEPSWMMAFFKTCRISLEQFSSSQLCQLLTGIKLIGQTPPDDWSDSTLAVLRDQMPTMAPKYLVNSLHSAAHSGTLRVETPAGSAWVQLWLTSVGEHLERGSVHGGGLDSEVTNERVSPAGPGSSSSSSRENLFGNGNTMPASADTTARAASSSSPVASMGQGVNGSPPVSTNMTASTSTSSRPATMNQGDRSMPSGTQSREGGTSEAYNIAEDSGPPGRLDSSARGSGAGPASSSSSNNNNNNNNSTTKMGIRGPDFIFGADGRAVPSASYMLGPLGIDGSVQVNGSGPSSIGRSPPLDGSSAPVLPEIPDWAIRGGSQGGGEVVSPSGLNAVDLCMALHALAYLHIRPSDSWLLHLLMLVEEQLPSIVLHPNLVAMLAWSLKRLRVKPPPSWINAYMQATAGRLQRGYGKQLSVLLSALAGWGMPQSEEAGRWMVRFWWRSLVLMDQEGLKPASMNLMLSSLVHMKLNPNSTWMLLSCTMKSIASLGTPLPSFLRRSCLAAAYSVRHQMQPEHWERFFWALTKLKVEVPGEWTSAAFECALPRLSATPDQRHISTMIAAAVKLHALPSPSWMEAWFTASQAQFQHMSPAALASTLHHLTLLNSQSGLAHARPPPGWLDAYLAASQCQLCGMSGVQLSHTVNALNHLEALPGAPWVQELVAASSTHAFADLHTELFMVNAVVTLRERLKAQGTANTTDSASRSRSRSRSRKSVKALAAKA
eukprot:gene6166-2779_t